jgi:hypothetical protein
MSMLSRRRDCLHRYGRIGSGGKVVIDFWICDKSLTPRRTQKSRRTHDSGRVVVKPEVGRETGDVVVSANRTALNSTTSQKANNRIRALNQIQTSLAPDHLGAVVVD